MSVALTLQHPPRQGQVESAEVAVDGLMTRLRAFTWCVFSRSAAFPVCSHPAASVSELVSLVFSPCAQIEEHSHLQNLARGFLGLPSWLWGLLGCVSPPLPLLLLWVHFPTFPPNLLWVKALFQQRARAPHAPTNSASFLSKSTLRAWTRGQVSFPKGEAEEGLGNLGWGNRRRNGVSCMFQGRRRTGPETDFAPGSEALGLHLCHSLEQEPFAFPEGTTHGTLRQHSGSPCSLSQESDREPI